MRRQPYDTPQSSRSSRSQEDRLTDTTLFIRQPDDVFLVHGKPPFRADAPRARDRCGECTAGGPGRALQHVAPRTAHCVGMRPSLLRGKRRARRWSAHAVPVLYKGGGADYGCVVLKNLSPKAGKNYLRPEYAWCDDEGQINILPFHDRGAEQMPAEPCAFCK